MSGEPPVSDRVQASAHSPTQRSAQAAAGNARARFEAEVLPHLGKMYRRARALECRPADAEDLVQEALTRALRAFGRFELREFGAFPWLLRILENVFYTREGKRRRELSLIQARSAPNPNTEADVLVIVGSASSKEQPVKRMRLRKQASSPTMLPAKVPFGRRA